MFVIGLMVLKAIVEICRKKDLKETDGFPTP